MRKLRLIVIDPNALTRALLRYVFHSSPGVEIISEAADYESAIRALGNSIPDALIMGSELPKTERKSLLSAIGSDYPGVKVIELSEVENYFLKKSNIVAEAGSDDNLLNAIIPDSCSGVIH